MKLSFSTLACPQWTLREIIHCALECGYTGIELRGYMGELAIHNRPEFSKDIGDTIRKLRDGGVEVSAISGSAKMHCVTKKAQRESQQEVERNLELATMLGAGMIRVFGGALHGSRREDAVKRSVEHLSRLCISAAPAGVTVAVETHDEWVHSGMLSEVVTQVRQTHGNVGVLWDMHHPFQLAGESPEQTYEAIGQFTVGTHVKDSRKTAAGGYEYCLPGEGEVPLERMLRLLARGGYDGYISVEWEKWWRPELAEPKTALPAYAEWLKGILAGIGDSGSDA